MGKKEGHKIKTHPPIKNHQQVTRDAEKLNNMLIENFVGMQRAVTNLSIKFESLSEQISKLLNLFEISAKSFSEKLALGSPEIEKDKEFLNKLDKLLEQNKLIAKGITLMEEKVREKVYGSPQQAQQRPMPRPMGLPTNQGNYMPSITREEE